jgi:hypothetical protein
MFPSEDDKVGNAFGKSLLGNEGKFMCSQLLPVNLHPRLIILKNEGIEGKKKKRGCGFWLYLLFVVV